MIFNVVADRTVWRNAIRLLVFGIATVLVFSFCARTFVVLAVVLAVSTIKNNTVFQGQ